MSLRSEAELGFSSWGGYKFLTERMGKYQAGEIASAKDRKLRLPKARSPSRLGDLGELRPSGLGRSPKNRRNFEHFKRKWSTFLDPVNLTFLNN